MTLAWKIAGGLLLLASALFPASVQAYTVGINGGTRMVYLRVGTGGMSGGNYNGGGTPTNLATINTVSVNVPAAAVGNGVDQTMDGDGNTLSQWDGYGFCNAGEIYIGGFFRHPSNGNGGGGPNNTATVTVTFNNPNLTNANGDTIPMSQISWTASGNGDTGGQPFPSGSFTASGQTIATFVRNQWNESCHRFRYGNDQLVAAGTYTNRVTYTITAP